MKNSLFLSLAASAACLSAAAIAQPERSGPGHSWSHESRQVLTRHGPQAGAMHPGPNFRHRRLQRGFFVHPYWFGPRFHVQNWQAYGFARPPSEHRWVRYYDDAYLIDPRGRVADTRYDLDWDEYGERWVIDDGIPHYEGHNAWRPGEEDYAWVERHGPGEAEDMRAYAREDGSHPMALCPPGPQPCMDSSYPAHAYPSYGYGVAYPIIIETTVTTHGCCETVTEEVVEVRQRTRPGKPRRAVPPRPRPPAGERG